MADRYITQPQPADKPVLFYGYVLMATSFIIQILIWGTYNVYGVFFTPLLTEFGWSRATISGAMSLADIASGVGAVVLGNLNNRFGPRAMMTFCGVLSGMGYLLMSQVHSVWQLYLFHGLIVGIGVSGTDVVLLAMTARWFAKRRGMMSGVVKMGTGVGIMIAPLIAAWLISGWGWRYAYGVMGAAIFICVVAGAQWLRMDPAQMGQYPDGKKPERGGNFKMEETGLFLLQAVRTRRFWMLCLSWPMVQFCTYSVVIHVAPYITDLGFPGAFGATMIAIIGGASIFGRFIMGVTGDKIGHKRGILICFVILIISFLWLLTAAGWWSLVLFASVYGYCHGGLYALYSPTVAEFFGTRAHRQILGIVILSGSVGGFLGPLVTGYIYDATLSYHTAFLLLLGLAFSGFVLMLLAGPGMKQSAQ